MSGALQAVYQNLRSFGAPPGQQEYTTSGTYTWVAPIGVTSVSAVVVSTGSPSGAGGGALAYKNNITVVPGNSYTVYISSTGDTDFSYFVNTSTVKAGGTNQGRTGDGGGDGGAGFGGGAGGYSGNGGTNPSSQNGSSGTAGSGGGGGGGGYSDANGNLPFIYGAGGGVGLLGQGSNGAGGSFVGGGVSAAGGGGGSGGASGGGGTPSSKPNGGLYGGGRGYGSIGGAGNPGGGAVRIIWPGNTRSFPSTNTGDL